LLLANRVMIDSVLLPETGFGFDDAVVVTRASGHCQGYAATNQSQRRHDLRLVGFVAQGHFELIEPKRALVRLA
jgi:hypothetical protein